MRLRHIEVFNAVMLTGSVSAAARLVNVTQPAVSRTLQHAELQLGFALFRRTRNRMVPTQEAISLYPHIERLFAQLEDVQRLAAGLRATAGGGALRIATVLALAYDVLPRAIERFRRLHPDTPIEVEALHSPQILAALVHQQADVGFAFSPAVHPSLSEQHLADTAMMCAAPVSMAPSKWARRGWVELADLASLPVIGLDGRDPVGTLLAESFREQGVGLPSTLTVQTYHAALAMAHHGLGAALVDGCTARSADPRRVVVLPLQPALAVPIHALRPRDGADSVAVRAITQAMQHALLQA